MSVEFSTDSTVTRCPCCGYTFAGALDAHVATPHADGSIWCADCAAGECHHDPFGLETPYDLFPPQRHKGPWYGPYAGALAVLLAIAGGGYVLIGEYLIGGLCAGLAVALANIERRPRVFFEDRPLSSKPKGSSRG